jgi:hypothetical protein
MTPTILPCGITLSPTTVLALAAEHIGHFHEMLELAKPGTRSDDCRYYLQLWTEVRTLINRGRRLGAEHLQELHDAVTSREYDAHLQSDELLAVLGLATTKAARRAS